MLIRTYTLTPDSFADLASARLRSRSIARWAATLPACERVVPRAEKRIEGVGMMELSCEGHCALSVEVRACSLGAVLAGARRARVCTAEMEECERRVERMCEPC